MIILTCLWSAAGFSQNFHRLDSIFLVPVSRLAGSGALPVACRLVQEMDYSLTGSGMVWVNRQHDRNAVELSLLQHARFQSQFDLVRNLKIVHCYVSDLGVEYFFDSISRFRPDENSLESRIEICLSGKWNVTLFSRLSTRLSNDYVYQASVSGTRCKVLSTSFLTPLTWTFSAGLGWTLPRYLTLGLGLSSAKLTYVRNRAVYDQLQVPVFCGVPKTKSHIFEYGVSMHLVVDHDFTGVIHWNCDLLLFKNYQKPVDLVMTSLVGIRFNRFLKANLRTHLSYDTDLSRKLQMDNMISAGFCFSL